MTREEFIKLKIVEKGFNLKEFAAHINMPYTTLLSIVNKSVGGASVDNAVRICSGLGITVDELQAAAVTLNKLVSLTPREKSVITAYREQPDMQPAVDRLLGLSERAPEIKRVARSGTPETSDTLTAEEAEAIAHGRRLKPTDEL